MSTINISQYLPADVSEADIDAIGASLLRNLARARKLRIVGSVERVSDESVVGVSVPGEDGQPTLTHVPMSDPAAKGKTEPDARRVTWQVEVEDRTGLAAVPVVGQVGNDGAIHGLLPAEIVENGGEVAFQHGLASEDVLITAYAADGSPMGYELAVEIKTGEHQLRLPPGISHLRAVVDEEN